MNRTDRLYAIVEELRASAPLPRTVQWLADHFEVAVRTVHRDLQALLEAGVPMWSTPGPGGGWFIDPKQTLPPLNLTADEALAVTVGLMQASPDSPFANASRSALAKVVSALAKGTAEEVRQVAARFRVVGDNRVGGPRTVIEQAIVDGVVVRLGYGDRHAQVTLREVEPHSLMFARGHWFLIGWCRLRGEGRGFRLDRIQSAELTGESVPQRTFAEVGGDLVNISSLHPLAVGLGLADG